MRVPVIGVISADHLWFWPAVTGPLSRMEFSKGTRLLIIAQGHDLRRGAYMHVLIGGQLLCGHLRSDDDWLYYITLTRTKGR